MFSHGEAIGASRDGFYEIPTGNCKQCLSQSFKEHIKVNTAYLTSSSQTDVGNYSWQLKHRYNKVYHSEYFATHS